MSDKAQLSFYEKITLLLIILRLRARFILENATPAQLQAISIPSYDAYLKWAKGVNEEPVVDHLPDGAPLWPAEFPTQLKQLISAIERLLSAGVHPSDLYLSGDSSGGNLIMQLISHILHPLNDVPKLSITFLNGPTKFGGVILFSPYTALTGQTGSHATNDAFDLVPASCLETWGKLYLDPIPEDHHLYVHANIAPERFFEGVDKIVQRFIITGGEKECLRDDIILFSDILKKVHGDVTLIVEKDAIHADPIFAFASKTEKLCLASLQVLEWISEETFHSSDRETTST
ncbi:hypothetical protein Clacol_000150 [Clathrus columnatus]|uniref:Alpha/beta hydrolase fold-3 domain-containing protein n=1 Tax=Clathrus columnatus TaxID=1419009 RepID=A0AAV4ZYM1_9AGAM|nr:hypothetical protein Clacol_000150 [Clathrus columnatus]